MLSIRVFLVGDESVCGLGPLIQDRDIDGQVAVQGGFTTKEGAKPLDKIWTVSQTMQFWLPNYGTGDLRKGSLQSFKVNIDHPLEQAIAENGSVKEGILKVPLQLDQNRDDLTKELNKYLEYRRTNCEEATVIDEKLSFKDIRK